MRRLHGVSKATRLMSFTREIMSSSSKDCLSIARNGIRLRGSGDSSVMPSSYYLLKLICSFVLRFQIFPYIKGCTRKCTNPVGQFHHNVSSYLRSQKFSWVTYMRLKSVFYFMERKHSTFLRNSFYFPKSIRVKKNIFTSKRNSFI